MDNQTNIKIPKRYHDAIKRVYKDSDGYWVDLEASYYVRGYSFFPEYHTIHEDTVADTLAMIRTISSFDAWNAAHAQDRGYRVVPSDTADYATEPLF